MENRKNRNDPPVRARLTGLRNIVRFNWHFYVMALAFVSLAVCGAIITSGILSTGLWIVASGTALTTLTSLIVSWYIYDGSDLYSFDWIDNDLQKPVSHLLNIHAGFDETSAHIQRRFPLATLHVYDFYNPIQHTEVSIRRARRATAPHPGTVSVSTTAFPATPPCFDRVFVIFAAHEIRDDRERIQFFQEIARVTQPDAIIHVVEHLRDKANGLAYTIGCLHFLSEKTWQHTFQSAGLILITTTKLNPFVVHYQLRHDANRH